ncbi:NAD(P)/FAD-dependent oxidoreductase [Flavobacteriaceae bacterium]|jgi:predicted Rossmann fold flavoprotein|nr:NAD(P)/FAD-dependent oxidoreductase [Flavobacteriaceae bacterium]MDB0068827.1 NAD(P)/FAD-dependent oxidoreductase [Flavobacteriaceae bacterium]MDB4092877.1 NAD(P)/FAD-dependent oxidoreductase [Flavobacteriaceae bacterium]
MKNIAVIGGGAAGFFSAISVKNHYSTYNVVLFEKSSKFLSKVKISGGGRCNVTNSTNDIRILCKAYPRGGKKLKNIFHQFGTEDTRNWFEERGVPLKVEPDGRVFPVSNNSQSIIDCLVHECEKNNILIKFLRSVKRLSKVKSKWIINFNDNSSSDLFDSIIVASGGSPKLKGFDWLKNLGHKIINPIPSLFTFNMPKESIISLSGIALKQVRIKIIDTKIDLLGPLLITHWGMSGPVILKASSIGARDLFEKEYSFDLQINWLIDRNTEILFKKLQDYSMLFSNKLLSKQNPFDLPSRLWLFLIEKSNLNNNKKWGELGKKNMRKLIEFLTKDFYSVSGKTTFKEEFVTCGGVSLENIELKTMQSKIVTDLYFAGEVLDIDGITGGYNFQSAWSTGFIAGKLGGEFY